MAYGSYSVYVTVEGSRGSGTAIVPVNSFATGRLPLSRGLGAILVVLAVMLVAGFLTLVRAGAGESLVAPGEAIDAPRRRRANVVTGMAAAILALALFGGAKWWGAEDSAYRGHMYGSPRVDADVLGGRIASNAAAPRPRHRGLPRDLLAGGAGSWEDDAPLPRQLHGNAGVGASSSGADGFARIHHRSAVGSRGALSAVRRHHAREWAESHGDDARRDSAGAWGGGAIGQRRHVGSDGRRSRASRRVRCALMSDGYSMAWAGERRADQGRRTDGPAIRAPRFDGRGRRASSRIWGWRRMPSSSHTTARCSFISIPWAR